MREKGEASQVIKNFIAMAYTQVGKNVKVMCSDNGSEFTCNPMQAFYQEHGLLRQSCCIDTPQENGHVKCKHRHVLNVARALLFEANFAIKF